MKHTTFQYKVNYIFQVEGHWEKDRYGYWRCASCKGQTKHGYAVSYSRKRDICPNCGRTMKG